MKETLFSISLIALLCVLGCDNQTTKKEKTKVTDTIDQSGISEGKSFVYRKYKLPLSVDIFKLLKSKNIEFSNQQLLPKNNRDKYFTEEKRALALGVYSSDLINAAIYDMSSVVVEYFDVGVELAHKLDVEAGYNAEIMDRAYKNLEDNDSLISLASEAYYKTCTELEKNNRDNILPLVVVGSWIESMHLLSKAVVGRPVEDQMYNELYIQKEHLINLIAYLNDVSATASSSDLSIKMKKWLSRLESIHAKYKELEQNKGLDQYNKLISQIEQTRFDIVE